MISMLVGMKINQIGLSENTMDPGRAGNLWVFVSVYAYQDCLILVLPVVDELDEVVYKLCSGIGRSISLLVKQSILLVVSVVRSEVKFLIVANSVT